MSFIGMLSILDRFSRESFGIPFQLAVMYSIADDGSIGKKSLPPRIRYTILLMESPLFTDLSSTSTIPLSAGRFAFLPVPIFISGHFTQSYRKNVHLPKIH